MLVKATAFYRISVHCQSQGFNTEGSDYTYMYIIPGEYSIPPVVTQNPFILWWVNMCMSSKREKYFLSDLGNDIDHKANAEKRLDFGPATPFALASFIRTASHHCFVHSDSVASLLLSFGQYRILASFIRTVSHPCFFHSDSVVVLYPPGYFTLTSVRTLLTPVTCTCTDRSMGPADCEHSRCIRDAGRGTCIND